MPDFCCCLPVGVSSWQRCRSFQQARPERAVDQFELRFGIAQVNRDHPFPKNSTDQILIDFGGEFPTYIEFSNLALASVVNENLGQLFAAATQFLPKEKRKLVRSRFAYLVSRHISCIPLSRTSLSNALELLDLFTTEFRPKANIRLRGSQNLA